MGTYYLLLGIIALVSWMVSSTLKRKFEKYSKTHLRNGMSGAEIAEKMLSDHGISRCKSSVCKRTFNRSLQSQEIAQ